MKFSEIKFYRIYSSKKFPDLHSFKFVKLYIYKLNRAFPPLSFFLVPSHAGEKNPLHKKSYKTNCVYQDKN